MRKTMMNSLAMLAVMTLLTGAAYPAAITLIARVLWPTRSEGSFVVRDGREVGSALIGQVFSDPRYFWGRPSATTPPYNAAASAGSNLGPTNPALAVAILERTAWLRDADPDARTDVPVDLVTASGSGLDPDVSPEAAMFQVPRIARARGLDEAAVRALVARRVDGRQLGIFGEPRVNILLLNLDLDAAAARP
jgi:K+-transporting ATPase ATPase C chain